MILITSTGELLLYFTVSFFLFHKKKKTVLQDCCWCLSYLAAEGQFQWVRDCKSRLNLNPMEEGQSGQLVEGGNPSSYMSMRDYINQSWQSQQPLERNPNEYRSMRDYRDQWMSAPSYMVPPQYTSTPQPPQPPQLISPVEQAIMDLTNLVGDDVVEQMKFNAQLSQKIHAVENPLEQKLDGFQSEMGQQFDGLQCSISKLAQQLDKKKGRESRG